MAKRSNSKSRNRQTRRDIPRIAKTRVLPPSTIRFSPTLPLTLFEDRRQWHPMVDHRPALTFTSRPHTLRAVEKKPTQRQSKYGLPALSQTKATIAFGLPDKVLVCVRRKRRKEVIFAKNKAGRSGQRKPRRNWLSAISCRS